MLDCLLVAVLLLSAPESQLSAAPEPATVEAPGTTASPGGAGTAEAAPLVADFPAYLAEVEKIRGLSFKGPVAKGRQSVEEFRAFIAREIDRDLPPATAGCTARALALLGLLPEAIDLRKAYSDILLSQVAAYYNPERKIFYVVRSDLPAEAMRPTVIHELTHALQDQRFGIAARMEALRKSRNEDEENAFRYLAEGEATYVMTLGALRDLGIDPEKNAAALDAAVGMTATLGREGIAAQIDTLSGALDADTVASLKGVLSYPEYFFRLLLDPYYVGQSAVHRAYRRGGWAAVNDLWKNPPTSTELFLHPEKLAAAKRDAPIEVEVPDLSAVLGPGYAPACANTLGEMETEILLETTLPKPGDRLAPDSGGGAAMAGGEIGDDADPAATRLARARGAAAGWGGDRYRTFEKSGGGGSVVVWKTTWDDDREADEFAQALNDVCRARMPGERPDVFHVASEPGVLPPLDATPRPHPFHPLTRDSAVLWKRSGDPAAESLLLVRKGRDVIFVAGASAGQAPAILRVISPSLAGTPSTPAEDAAPPPTSPPPSR